MKKINTKDINDVKRLVKRIKKVIQDDNEELFAVIDKLGAFHVSGFCCKSNVFFIINNTEFDSKEIDVIVSELYEYLNS